MIEWKERLVKSRTEQLDSKDKRINQLLNEVQLKEKELESLQTWLQERDERNVDSLSHRVKSDQSRINMDGRSLQMLMNEIVEKIDSAGSLLSDVLHASTDPAKLVLDAMQGFYPSDVDVENRDLETDHLRVVRKSCMILLQELKRMSPIISPQVREEAVKLAADWDEKMAQGADNSWEASGFLWLITTYQLTSSYHLRELRMLLDEVSQPDEVAELSRALGIIDTASAGELFLCFKILFLEVLLSL